MVGLTTLRAEQAVADLSALARQASAERDACQAECPGSSVVGELIDRADQAVQRVAEAKTPADTCRQREERARQAR